ncbi:MAG TPA: hypothetical protein VMW83_11690 [Spirochaetia bacterium]|nr:hypothetical protein [Spirochaetia bacterium]
MTQLSRVTGISRKPLPGADSDLPELLGGQAMRSTETVYGKAEFPVGA